MNGAGIAHVQRHVNRLAADGFDRLDAAQAVCLAAAQNRNGGA
jgi:hypothetical protein